MPRAQVVRAHQCVMDTSYLHMLFKVSGILLLLLLLFLSTGWFITVSHTPVEFCP